MNYINKLFKNTDALKLKKKINSVRFNKNKVKLNPYLSKIIKRTDIDIKKSSKSKSNINCKTNCSIKKLKNKSKNPIKFSLRDKKRNHKININIKNIFKSKEKNDIKKLMDEISKKSFLLPYVEKPKVINKKYDKIHWIGLNTNKGKSCINEDRINIILNFKIKNNKYIQIIGLFDGFNGLECSETLKNDFINFVLNGNFLKNNSIDFDYFSKKILEFNKYLYINLVDKKSSSSCLVIIVLNGKYHWINIGSSKVLLSKSSTKLVKNWNFENSEKIFFGNFNNNLLDFSNFKPTFITDFIKDSYDFLLLTTNSISQSLKKQEIIEIMSSTYNYNKSMTDTSIISLIINNILKKSVIKGTKENVSLIIILFKPLSKIF